MDNRGYQHYKEQSVSTMTSGELLLLVYDELLKRLLRCDLALTKQNYELADESADRCLQIIRYLDDTLDSQYPISRDLHRLYEYFSFELNRIKIGRNKAELDVIRPMIADLRESFRAADKNAASEKESKDGTV